MASKKIISDYAQRLVSKLLLAFALLRKILPAGVSELPALKGLHAKGFSESPERVLHSIAEILRDSKVVFRHGDRIVVEKKRIDGEGRYLVVLLESGEVRRSATGVLDNLFKTGADKSIPVPKRFVEQLLRSDIVLQLLPNIQYYASRPIFDLSYNLCGSGWNADSGILMHGPVVEPDLNDYSQASDLLDRVPPRLRELLRGFCFLSNVDLTNTLGVLITGPLLNHFIREQKALVILDGNQPGLGKTLLARCIGMILDSVDPKLIPYTSDDDELAKRVCATIRTRSQSVVVIDNAKRGRQKEISSPFLEANSTASHLSMRILGESRNFNQENDLLWFITMNLVKASPDLVSRSIVIQLYLDGNPRKREFGGFDPIAYCQKYSTELLGELAGLIIRWNQHGRPMGKQSHRLHTWAQTIGGILEVAGFSDFLGNADQVASSISVDADKLATLAEFTIRSQFPAIDSCTTSISRPQQTQKLQPLKWKQYFQQVGVLMEELQGSDSSSSIAIGKFFSPQVDHTIEFDLGQIAGTATLRSEKGTGKRKFYFFELSWEEQPTSNLTEQIDVVVPPDLPSNAGNLLG